MLLIGDECGRAMVTNSYSEKHPVTHHTTQGRAIVYLCVPPEIMSINQNHRNLTKQNYNDKIIDADKIQLIPEPDKSRIENKLYPCNSRSK